MNVYDPISNPLPALVGVPLLALLCWSLSRVFPLLENESRAHASSLPLDGLRGLLASSVFFHHAFITYVFMQTGEWAMPSSNFYGQLGPSAVTVFFFISGYLFWGKMLRNPGSLSPRRLWPNRIRRLVPAYWAAVILAFAVTAVVTAFQLREPLAHTITAAAEWLFFGFPSLPGLNGLTQERITSGVFWSLRMEVLFYLLLPALVWFRKGRRLILLLLLGAVAFVIPHWLHSQTQWIEDSIGNFRRFAYSLCATFSVGMIAAYHPWNARVVTFLRSRWAAALCVLIVIVHLVWVKAGYTLYEPILLVPIFFTIAEGNSIFGLLSSRPARCLGQISYSFYVFHGIILFFLTTLWNAHHPIASMSVLSYWALVLGIGAVVVIFTTFTYWFIERPFLTSRPGSLMAGQTKLSPSVKRTGIA